MDIEQFNSILQERCRLLPGLPVVVGVSGGADSLCLLDLLARAPYPVTVAHFNHRLRPEAGRDAAAARAAAERLGVAFVAGDADVAGWAQAERRSLEEAARILRYRFLFEQARRLGAQAVAVGHTADDQVETVLMHLIQGSGLAGLTGMAYRSRSPWDEMIPLVRPLLGVWREETLAHCRERGLAFVTDASNHDLAYTRNRVRWQLIPELERYNPSVRQAIWRMAQVLAGEEEIVQEAVQSAWEACLAAEQPGCLTFDLERLRRLSHPLRRGVVRRAATRLLADGAARREVAFEDVERAAAFILAPSRSGQMDFVQGIRLVIAAGGKGKDYLLALGPGQAETGLVVDVWPQVDPGSVFSLSVPGVLDLGGGWKLTAELAEWAALEESVEVSVPGGEWEAWLDGDALTGPLVVRAARPGERFMPLGMGGRSMKLSDFWINEKLPRRARAGWPLVFSGEKAVWVPGFRPAHPFRVQAKTRRVVVLRMMRISS